MTTKKIYTYDEVYKATLDYFDGNKLATEVWINKYALSKDRIVYDELTPDDMHRRLAKELSRIEQKYPNPIKEEEIYDLLKGFDFFVMQGSPMSAIGNPYVIQSAGNCYSVEPPYDSYGGILKTDQELAQLMKRRAGVGMSLDNIRPKGLVTKNAAKTTDGISVFMERFSNTCREVAQKGRRGAEIQCLSVHHPEIKTFINIKQNKTKVTGANISVKLSDEFLEAVDTGTETQLRWPVDNKESVYSSMIDARELWEEIVYCAWSSAEPGILFFDEILRNSIPDQYAEEEEAFKTTAVNPCGEIPLGRDSCRLSLINLFSFVKNPFTKKAKFDYDHFEKVVQKAQRLMDNLIDLELELMDNIIAKVNSDPEPDHIKAVEKNMWVDFRKTCAKGRRTGLGITALGDTLAALNVQYGSEDSIDIVKEIYRTLCLSAYRSSCILAQERGPFPIYDYTKEKDNQYLQRIWKEDSKIKKLCKETGRRNIALTTTAPAGSVSLLTQTTSGIEPLFLTEYTRRRKLDDFETIEPDLVDDLGDRWIEYDVVHRPWKKWQEISGEIKIEKSPYYKAMANEINWVNKVKMQAAAQKFVCHSISSTVNLPKEATVEDVKKIYMEAWRSGCKGITVYREGSRLGVLVPRDENTEKSFVFVLEDGSSIQVKDDENIEYNGKTYKAAELFRTIQTT